MLSILLLAATHSASALTCDLYPSNTCSSSVATVTSSGSTSLASVQTKGYVRMDVFATVCSPTGYVLHLSDSPSSKGVFWGDSGNADHDSSFALVGENVYWTSATDASGAGRRGLDLLFSVFNPSWSDGSGCYGVSMTYTSTGTRVAKQPTAEFNPDVWELDPVSPVFLQHGTQGARNNYGAASSSSSSSLGASSDWEDRALLDLNLWYVGINRNVTGSSTGSGVQEACMVLSTSTAAPTPCL